MVWSSAANHVRNSNSNSENRKTDHIVERKGKKADRHRAHNRFNCNAPSEFMQVWHTYGRQNEAGSCLFFFLFFFAATIFPRRTKTFSFVFFSSSMDNISISGRQCRFEESAYGLLECNPKMKGNDRSLPLFLSFAHQLYRVSRGSQSSNGSLCRTEYRSVQRCAHRSRSNVVRRFFFLVRPSMQRVSYSACTHSKYNGQ